MPKHPAIALLLFVLAIPIGCDRPSPGPAVPKALSSHENSPPEIIFLTRDGCANTPEMMANLDAVIDTLGSSASYSIVNQGALAPTDPRIGYPTPTVLLDGRDLFGLPKPRPPYPSPS